MIKEKTRPSGKQNVAVPSTNGDGKQNNPFSNRASRECCNKRNIHDNCECQVEGKCSPSNSYCCSDQPRWIQVYEHKDPIRQWKPALVCHRESQNSTRPQINENRHPTLNTFGDGNYRKQKCEVLSLPLRDINNDEIAAITVLSSPVICSPLNMTVEVSKYPHLQGLQLADSSKSHKSIDVLIGSDYYWDFVTGDTVCGEFGPTAINSKFGWLVSGPTAKCVTNDDITVSNLIISGNCSNMHETSQDPLVDTLKQFWETETIGIKHSVPKELPSVSPVPRNDIERNGQIYKVGLPWKEDFMPSSDNYGMYASGLRSLHYKLRKEPELLSEYDRIIQEQQKAGITRKFHVTMMARRAET